MPVVVVAPTDAIFDRRVERRAVEARDGKLVLLSDAAGVARLGSKAAASITLPTVDPVVAPILYAVPLQLLAYYTALAKAPTSTSRAISQERDGRVATTGTCSTLLGQIVSGLTASVPKVSPSRRGRRVVRFAKVASEVDLG